MTTVSGWVPVWDPSPLLRPVRHQVNNLLAPLVVAAEILDDGSETAALLQRAVSRARSVSTRLGDLLHMGPPSPVEVGLPNLLAILGLEAPSGDFRCVTVLCDAPRLLVNVLEEIRALDPVSVTADVASRTFPSASPQDCLVVVAVFDPPLAVTDPALVAVPLTVPGADVRTALICRETHLHGGAVRYDAGVLEVCLPLVIQGTSR